MFQLLRVYHRCRLLHVALRKSAYLSEALIRRLDREHLTACLINQRNAFSSEVCQLLRVEFYYFYVKIRDFLQLLKVFTDLKYKSSVSCSIADKLRLYFSTKLQ